MGIYTLGVVVNMAVGKDTQVSRNQHDPDAEAAAARRLSEAFRSVGD
jgi:hypothetical protein